MATLTGPEGANQSSVHRTATGGPGSHLEWLAETPIV